MARRSLPGVADVLLVVVVATDWPLGCSGWLNHPLLAAVVAGLLVLVLTGRWSVKRVAAAVGEGGMAIASHHQCLKEVETRLDR